MKSANSLKPLLRVVGVTKRFGGLTAVDGVTFDVTPQEIVALIGPNGAGKTTLFSLISGFQAADEGSVAFEGRDVTGFAPARMARLGLARSFQIVQVFADLTVHEAVTAAALMRHSMADALKKADETLALVGLSERKSSVTPELSLQDRKLLEVAKCLATEPTLILLDEVMAGLTLSEAEVVLDVIRRLRSEGMTFVLVEHVMPIVMSIADRIVVMNFGQKIADGTPKEIIENQFVRDAYFGEDLHA
jgi:branched-chain amino acid transport system ATP-binding protein